ncbi:TPA: GntR family transcriptional regulator [Providencia rettgeri]
MPYIVHLNSYFIWLPLPEGIRSESVNSKLSQHSIAVSNANYSTTVFAPQSIHIAVSTVSYQELESSLETIKSVMLYMIDL